jgi:coenzyme F420-reducing hydrogenase delta subunit
MRAVRVMCSGMVHPEVVQQAFERGADGVIVMG